MSDSEKVKTKRQTHHGKNGDNGSPRPPSSDPLPGFNLRELYEERNWAALAGLVLVALGVVYLVETLLGFDLNLWALAMAGIGGWLSYEAWQEYQEQGRTWSDRARNRLTGGIAIGAIGLLGLFSVSLWGVLLLGVGGWLGYDTWQKYQDAGRTWTPPIRNRMLVAGGLGLVGLMVMAGSWNLWALALIGVGLALLFGAVSNKR